LFVHARACCHSSVPFPAVIDLCPCVPFCARLRWSPFVLLICPHSVALAGPPAYHCSFVPFTARLCSSPFIHWSPFIPTRLCPLSCACSRYLVALVWLLLVLVGVGLGLFVLVQLLFTLVWASSCSFML
jgi:hypothetical protein